MGVGEARAHGGEGGREDGALVLRRRAAPCGAGAFANLAVATAPKGLPFNETTPVLAAPQWAASYEVEGAGDPGAPVCGGNASFSGPAATAAVNFDCALPH